MKILRWVLPVVLVYGAFANAQNDKVKTLVGKQIPAFTMTTFAGKKLTSASLKGKPMILDFWATWCGPCKAASPTMQKLQDKYKSKGLVVIGADILEGGSNTRALKYPVEHKYTYTFTKDNEAYGQKLGITGLPCIIFVDKTGKIVAVESGFSEATSPAKFEAHVKKMI